MIDVLRVALDVPLPQCFDYLAPDGDAIGADWIGCRVRVPFGRRERVGVVLEVRPTGEDPASLRPARARLDADPVLDAELLATLQWAAAYYLHPPGEVMLGALPVGLRQGAPLPPPTVAAWRLAPVPPAAPVPRGAASAILAGLAAGARTEDALRADHPAWPRWRARLAAAGFIVPASAPPTPTPGPPLDPQQRAALAAIRDGSGFRAVLLDGVTGSGKTEVYLALIAEQLAAGRQSLVLVPEIGLTPQMLARFRARLGVPVAALHSGLADGERTRAWLAAARGEALVVVGTRSAVFTPLPRAGLIVVDEEHDASYKQQDGLRYHARDLALVRGRALGVPVVLGSATPALESLHNAARGRYRHVRLTRRAGAARPPTVQLVDLRGQRLEEGLSPALLGALAACVDAGGQALVFRNRRGFAPLLLCHTCGWHAGCPRCDVGLTVHRGHPGLRCHHCGHGAPLPRTCPDCGSAELLPLGAGTERLEESLRRRFPAVPVHRIDRDTTRRRDALADVLTGLAAGGPAILVGTQMLAKGHDLPELALAAVVGADEGLFAADFRGPERLAQLLIQVAGRAGRGARPGTVLLQTHHPEHPLFRQLLDGGYAAFADEALAERAALGFPPYAHLAVVRAEAKVAESAEAFLVAARAALAPDAEVEVRGPLPAPLPRRAGFLRRQLVLQSPSRAALHASLRPLRERLTAHPAARRVRWSLDVDPLDLY